MGTTYERRFIIPLVKMKRRDRAIVIKELLVKQRGICLICGKDITRVSSFNLVIDHDHVTGVVRAVLHRGCNGMEGKILRLLRTWGKANSVAEAVRTLERLIAFWKLHSTPQTEWIYYSHKTAAEKRVTLNKKRRKAAKLKKERK